MSTIKVEVTTIESVRPHANADALELATVGGWQVCVRKGAYRDGDRVVYFEQGTVLPRDMAEQLGVANYLSEKTDIHGARVLVVHRVKLRGEPSFGLVLDADEEVGADVAARYGATKYMPPVKFTASDAIPEHPLFPPYTDIENMRSYPDVFEAGEVVIATEKAHGTNCGVGFVSGPGGVTPMARSRTLTRKAPVEAPLGDAALLAACQRNTYWFPFTLRGVGDLFAELSAAHRSAVLYGEVYGAGIQSYTYGEKGLAFAAFDLLIDGAFVDYPVFAEYCARFGIPMVPLLYRGPFDIEAIRARSDGESAIGGAHGREGVVVRPLAERQDSRIGRAVLKYVGDGYLFNKHAAEDYTDQ